MTAAPIGTVVHYRLSEYDTRIINQKRSDSVSYRRLNVGALNPGTGNRSGFQEHVGNNVSAGDYYPAIVVRVFNPTTSTRNLQVLLDGNDTYWATSASEGDGNGQWTTLD